ncbi:exosortase-dependent surface protein XDP1 [Colwellia sp. UCD-KL20]|uniref:exosortase-dependent surface protein XDP1 n=1 Tax=Colwellia sp. UCD-KL20 TaxID=1917165 RepID=UPI0009713F51|nr:exosortase-dependent surface protein XDP1 [Colwellia sp. UCD-KL20]
MLLNISKLSIAGLALMSASALASTTYANFGSVSDTGNNFNQFSVVKSGINITVSGWSDTEDMGNGNPLSGDDKITKAVDFDKNADGWSMTNSDEINTSNCGYHHSADNLGNKCGYQDYDMFLVEFSEAVNLSKATYSWIYNDGNSKNGNKVADNQVTVAALSDKSLLGKDWGQVKNSQTMASGYSQMQKSGGYYTNFTSASSNVNGTFSRYWLIGALNSVFSSTDTSSLEGNDGFKLSGVSFTKGTPPPATSVPEPTSIMMFGLALVGLFAANRRKIK